MILFEAIKSTGLQNWQKNIACLYLKMNWWLSLRFFFKDLVCCPYSPHSGLLFLFILLVFHWSVSTLLLEHTMLLACLVLFLFCLCIFYSASFSVLPFSISKLHEYQECLFKAPKYNISLFLKTLVYSLTLYCSHNWFTDVSQFPARWHICRAHGSAQLTSGYITLPAHCIDLGVSCTQSEFVGKTLMTPLVTLGKNCKFLSEKDLERTNEKKKHYHWPLFLDTYIYWEEIDAI